MKAAGTAREAMGLTIVEVLVAMAMLAVLAAAIVAGFSSIVQINRTASEDVDYSRVIRTLTEEVRVAWTDPQKWDVGVTLAELTEGVNASAQELSPDCTAAVTEPFDESAVLESVVGGERLAVRVLEVVCGREGARRQVYAVEFGAP